MATAKYELMEEHSRINRAEIGNAKEYWKNCMDDLVNQMLPFYDYEIEDSSQYIEKKETTYLYNRTFNNIDKKKKKKIREILLKKEDKK